MDDKVPTTLPT